MTTHAEISRALQARWPEHRVAPSLARIRALTDLLGEPQTGYPVIQVAGTNGKGSTAIIIEALLLALGLRVGRIASPHLVDLTERINLDGRPMDAAAFDALVADVQPLVDLVDAQRLDDVSMTFFEVMTGLGFEAFAQAPVDVAVVEVGLGGTWDATSVADADVAVICPIDLDHTHLLGDTLEEIATEKAGIIKPGSIAVVARQHPEVDAVIAARAAEVGARVLREGVDFGLIDRTLAVGGQVLRLETVSGPASGLVLPVHGEHMAHNAALAVAAVEALLGGKPLVHDIIAEGFATVKAPARLELVRSGPPIVLDTCHNVHGTRATLAGVREAYDFTPLIAVVGMMADKDVEGVLALLAEEVTTIICTRVASTDRGLPADELGELAEEAFGAERVHVRESLPDALELAVTLADEAGAGAGILVAGSVILAGEARALLVRNDDEEDQR
ncbi:bifunctional folylpolyglutamate synthase/dihydrofolate synthase [Propioniciclava sp. MC1595]|uniref:bifunctional folylpolyglutamate synthase/dihydrofolate synthase n=1 Tax=unclassified Propioniciclava TaxID=2642922 RepID=UPI0015FF7C05|nr:MULTISPECIES: folylpolyglutamate synthase/dihydrofolate synthase family protein [unclassified Propioniciclava]MBB1493801.1 bifunctional folylpolyglutamate synthase/dihydrofolate synthase [Propioniciclava sp. MC1595]MBB1501008.1 bifunctional folylpolyglutamate synthase/dihydrofolate synthase [Propioniciclava sp. MC1683]QTE25000.1 bifunctional folylpolyglutamate synthase/dihydrofolate synthase [Propioniciclava sp. MC1595]